jgi:hypothetical protein
MFNTLFTLYTVFWYSLSRCMCVTWSWRTCILAFRFSLKSGCDNCLLHAFRRFPSGFELFLSSGSFPSGIGLTGDGHRSDRCSSQVLGNLAHQSDRWGWPVGPVRTERLQLLCFMWCFACIRPGGVALVQGELACVQGGSLWFSSFGLVVCVLCLSIVLSRMCRVVALA